jgi:hypothetical protein
MSPRRGSTPRLTGWLTVSRNVTLTLTGLQRFFFPVGGVGLVPKFRYLLTLAYYTLPRGYEFGERRWNYTFTGENGKTRRKPRLSATLSTTNPTWIDPGLRGERPALTTWAMARSLQRVKVRLQQCFTNYLSSAGNVNFKVKKQW